MAIVDSPTLKAPVGPDDHVRGPDDAPVTLVEYGNYECRHCRQVVPIIDELRDQFGDTLRYVFRHFPLDLMHPHARLAAEAAEAAGAQGKFWEMHDLLFKHQVELDRANLIEYAADLGLDVERFRRELDEGVHRARVQRDVESAVASSARGTPTFYLNRVRYDGPWDLASLTTRIEKPLGVRVRLMFQMFANIQASSGILLLLATAAALAWANSPWGQSYFDVWETYLTIALGDVSISEDLLHWVNDGLMVIFFFLVGMEIKREVLIGELASLRKATLPLMGAVGGFLFPAAIYAAINRGGEGSSGWGIPMATDIAFLLGLLTVLGRRVPIALKIFFTALAIVDDLGAVLVIAIFYSGDIAWLALVAGVGFLVALAVLNWGGVRNPLPYALLGIGLWLAFLQSGIHPTIAGVLLAMTIPARNPEAPAAYAAQCSAALGRITGSEAEGEEIGRQQAAAQTLETLAERLQSPLRRLERLLIPWVSYLVVPIFAFANAGVDLGGDLGAMLTSPVALGIVGGLVLGKPIGITLFSWLAIKLRIADLPAGVSWAQLFGASWLAGIGFTMSLFIAGSAFERPAVLDTAKAAILVASLLASMVGVGLLTLTSAGEVLGSRLDEARSSG